MNYISFDTEIIDIDYVLKIGITNAAYKAVCEKFGNPDAFFLQISALDTIVVTPRTHQNDLGGSIVAEDDEDKFWINTSFGRLLCGISERTLREYTLISYKETDLMSHNRALRYGTVFRINKGIKIKALLPGYGVKCMYTDGVKQEFVDLNDELNLEFSDVINKNINKEIKPKKNDQNGEQEPYPEDRRLLSILKKAEEYAILGSELEEKRIHEMGRISYREFRSSDYDRTDRIAYTFIVDSVDKRVFKEGVQVEIDGTKEDKLNGEIIEINDMRKDNIELTVLFNKQVSYGMISPFGWIALSYSTVNKDVQLDAIRKISAGTAKAKYMGDVIGLNSPSGFVNNDLSEIMHALEKRKYPPNNSQLTAIEKGINSKDVFLVMGPPGTGKTTVILEWVKYFVGVENKRVLVSSQNNKAVDNVLARLAEEKDIDILRIGSEAKLQEDVLPYMFENKLITLNEDINKVTKYITDTLVSAIEEWEKYRNKVIGYMDHISAIISIREQVKKNIQSILLPIRLEQKSLWHEYNEKYSVLLNKKDVYSIYQKKINQIMDEDSLQIEKYRNKHKELAVNIAALSKELCSLKEKYEELKREYNKQKDDLLHKYIKDMVGEESHSIVKDSYEILPEKYEELDLFTPIYYSSEFFKSESGLRVYLKKIDNEIKRAKTILDAERSWRNSVVGKQNYALNEILMESVDLVGATCIGINSQRRFSNMDFDVTIIDEAGQIQIQNALVPMSVSNKLIMLGDHKQIPPSLDQEMVDLCDINGVDPDLLEISLFEKLFNDLPTSNKMMLDTQYRMPGEIADIISEWFYDAKYKSPKFKYNMKGILDDISEKPFVIIDTAGNRNRFEKRTIEHGSFNEYEAIICACIMEYIIKYKPEIDLHEIGIISAYKDQVKTIVEKLKDVIQIDQAYSMVATLDSFQGQERDLIIYSFTKSSAKSPQVQRIGFLNELRRLNVAITRCKKTLILIGDMKFLSECLNEYIDEGGRHYYEKSEKQFSDFIKKMLFDVKMGKGEILKYDCLKKRMELCRDQGRINSIDLM